MVIRLPQANFVLSTNDQILLSENSHYIESFPCKCRHMISQRDGLSSIERLCRWLAVGGT